jgi:hypothetical protein
MDALRPPAMDMEGNPACYDGDPSVRPLAPRGDNLALCIFKSCDTGCGCAAPLQCVEGAMGVRTCAYPGAMDTVVPCMGGDGGTSDGGTDGGATEAGVVDAGVTDVTVVDVATGG